MSTTAKPNIQQLQQDIQNELFAANQLTRLISMELQKIKKITSPGGEFQSSIRHNSDLVMRLGNIHNIDLTNVPPMVRKRIATHENQKKNCDPNTTIIDSDIDESGVSHMET